MNDLPKDEKSSDDAPLKVSYHFVKSASQKAKEQKSEEEEVIEDEDTEEENKETEDEEIDQENSAPIKSESKAEDQETKESEDPEEDQVTDDQDGSDEEDEIAQPRSNREDSNQPEQYYLQVVKVGEQPEWPRPKEDLNVFSQPLPDGLIQYWAYLQDSPKTSNDLPHAEDLARNNPSNEAVIIIDQICHHLTPGSCLELVLSKERHALAKTDSNLENLEANIASLLDLGRQSFGIKAEHFMSTSNVSPEVEKRLDDLEEAEEKEAGDFNENREHHPEKSPYFTDRPELVKENKHSKLTIFILILLLLVIFGGVVYYRGQLLSKFMNKINSFKPAPETTPTSTPTPTPTLSIERSNFKVRILNGTPKTGAAAALADKLKEKGWQIDKTANATSSAIPESYVRGKIGNDVATGVLISDITDYQGSSSSSLLKSTDKADLEFVIGKK